MSGDARDNREAPAKVKPLIDAAGFAHRPAGSDARIVSLVPSITETLFALELGPLVVGRTAYCVHPRDRVRSVRSVGGTKKINGEKLKALAPSHVIVNIDETPRALAESLAAAGYVVVVTHPVEVEDNRALLCLLGGLFDRAEQARGLIREFDAALADLDAVAAGLPDMRILYLIWKDPWMTVSAETYIARMLARIRWQVVGGCGPGRYPEVSLDEDLLASVDLILFSSEPFPFKDRHLGDFSAAHPAHADKALPIDGEMTSWYGARAVAGLRYLAALARNNAVKNKSA